MPVIIFAIFKETNRSETGSNRFATGRKRSLQTGSRSVSMQENNLLQIRLFHRSFLWSGVSLKTTANEKTGHAQDKQNQKHNSV